jgi:hypothetical protein
MHDEEKTTKKKNLKTKKKPNKAEANSERYDKEIEEFKKMISVQTNHARTIRKVKPLLTDEWLESLIK